MLISLKFVDMVNKLNIYKIGTNSVNLFVSCAIRNKERGFEDVPGKGWFNTGLCSIGLCLGSSEFKIGPSLGRQWARYQKRYIDNEATRLKHIHSDNSDQEVIGQVENSCTTLANEDINQIPKDYKLATTLGVIALAIKYISSGFAVGTLLATASVPILIIASRKIKGTDAGEKFWQFVELVEQRKNVQAAYREWGSRNGSWVDLIQQKRQESKQEIGATLLST